MHREIADVLRDMVTIAMANMALHNQPPPDPRTLEDAEVLALADLQLPPKQDHRMSVLLDRQQAALLDEAERRELATLMQTYQEGMLIKAGALEEAVRRGLRPPPAP